MIGTALALPLVLAAGAGGQVDAQQVTAPGAKASYAARVVVQSAARSGPSARSARVGTVNSRAPWDKGPMQLMAVKSAADESGKLWIKLLLARKPNGTYGWIPADHAQIFRNQWRVTVDRSSRRMTVFKGGRAMRSTKVVVGARSTPTPTGLFAIREVVKQPDPGGFSGPWIFHLNANSQKLKSFDGGDGTIGIHGRGGASLSDPLGSARSHGCVRVPNNLVRYLARHVVAGTPVLVRR
ncbi:MAG: L,D-transpeptidase [Thermoleophilaceae bacterium]|nr:L,D-transpeptidase [Thermoleophilaceae bacterium]